jgi:hypothetical protein
MKDAEVTFIGDIQPFTKGYDLIINFDSHPLRLLYLRTCSGKKVTRICGSDWYRAKLGKPIQRMLLYVLRIPIMYASEELFEEVGLKGVLIQNPVNDFHFYPRDVPRDKETCYYVCGGKDIYYPEKRPAGATLLDGSIPYEEMPWVLSQHEWYVRYTTHDAEPKLPIEALLCGCHVLVNGDEITLDDVPNYMLSSYQIPKWAECARAYISSKTLTSNAILSASLRSAPLPLNSEAPCEVSYPS